MKNQDYIAIAFLGFTMGFVVIVALVFRPHGSINLEFGKNPSLTIGENSKVIQR